MLGQSVGEAPDASKLLAAPPPVEAPSRAASIYTHTGGGAPQAPPRPADGAFLSRRLVTAAGAPPPFAPTVRGGTSPASWGSDSATGLPRALAPRRARRPW